MFESSSNMAELVGDEARVKRTFQFQFRYVKRV